METESEIFSRRAIALEMKRKASMLLRIAEQDREVDIASVKKLDGLFPGRPASRPKSQPVLQTKKGPVTADEYRVISRVLRRKEMLRASSPRTETAP